MYEIRRTKELAIIHPHIHLMLHVKKEKRKKKKNRGGALYCMCCTNFLFTQRRVYICSPKTRDVSMQRGLQKGALIFLGTYLVIVFTIWLKGLVI